MKTLLVAAWVVGAGALLGYAWVTVRGIRRARAAARDAAAIAQLRQRIRAMIAQQRAARDWKNGQQGLQRLVAIQAAKARNRRARELRIAEFPRRSEA